MERVQEALENEDFLWFLNNTCDYTNGPTRYHLLVEWLDKASNGPAHLRTTFLKRAVLDFERFLDIFSSLPPPSLPSFRYSLPPPFPKRVCLLGWPYLESRTTSQTKPPSNFDLDAFLARVIADKDNSHVRNQQQQHLARDVYGLCPFLDFNSYWINVWPWFFLHSNGTSLDDTFKLDVYLDLRLIYGWFFTPRQKMLLVLFLVLFFPFL
jgi:hypothetical protein